jgi:threonine/homoserine/homoserine lactone efflux protein
MEIINFSFNLTQTGHLWLFFVLVFGIIAMPGMEMAFVLSSTFIGGRRAGFAAVSGSVVGGFVHVAMSSLGIGLLLQHMPAAFNALLLAGALYVGWMGVQMWRAASLVKQSTVGQSNELGATNLGAMQTAGRTFARALLTCLLNPKAYVFMLAVFPQFFRPQYGSLAAQAVVLALICAATQIAIYGLVVVTAARSGAWLQKSAANQQLVARLVGALLIGTAAWTLVAGWSN